MSVRTSNIALTYGGAAWLVVIGVFASWFFLKQNAVQTSAELPRIPELALLTPNQAVEDTLIERAEVAYAAGRITRPQGDSALDYYRQQLVVEPGHSVALDGLRRVTGYLVNGAETALRREDWNAARDLAQEAKSISSNAPAVRSVIDRITQHDQITQLTALAHEQINRDHLTQPKGNNALHSYRTILTLNPAHTGAKQGIELIAQRLASLAQTEAFADRTQRARELIDLARSIAPDAPGIEAAQQLTNEWSHLTKDQAVKDDIQAAAMASQQGRLLTSDQPGQLGALELYESALSKDPGSDAAIAGIAFIAQSVVDRAWKQLDNEEFEAAETALNRISDTSVDTSAVNAELAFLRRRAGNRAGNFDPRDFVALSDLKVKRRVQPTVDGDVPAGTVELNFTVDENGDVIDIDVIEAGNPALTKAALAAVERWKFSPYLVDGRVLTVRTGILMRIEA